MNVESRNQSPGTETVSKDMPAVTGHRGLPPGPLDTTVDSTWWCRSADKLSQGMRHILAQHVLAQRVQAQRVQALTSGDGTGGVPVTVPSAAGLPDPSGPTRLPGDDSRSGPCCDTAPHAHPGQLETQPRRGRDHPEIRVRSRSSFQASATQVDQLIR
jgi:hypothetical protein